ncbi:MAG: transposase [Nanoarchaeota archaeon]|nr:transposase [Nanoarchaeota archaeon]
MGKQNKLINKVKYLLKKCNMPRFLHYFGPKMYELWQHIFALFVRTECQLSYRRTTTFLRNLGFDVATKSTLQRYSSKLLLPFWQKVFQQTITKVSKIVSLDGTGLERTKASEHYIHRIDAKRPFCKGYHLSIVVGEKSKILSLRIRQKYCHDIKDVKYLTKRLPEKPRIILMDKGYDSEKLHRYFAVQNIRSIAPVKKNWARGQIRKKLKNNFPQKLYNKRSRIESIFHALKQKFGSSVSSKKITSARTEVYCRAILHNLFFLRIIQVLGQTRKLVKFSKIYI